MPQSPQPTLQPVPDRTLDQWLAHAERLHPKTIDMTLDRVRAVAGRMALRLDCPVFTVAGTNGKGSTCALLEAMLTHAGYRVGLYTSPHLVRYEERCRLRGAAVDAATLAASFARVEVARAGQGEGVSLTYFEFGTLAALDVFARARLDAVILEVGLGGRLDAVNVIDTDCAVITSIDLDHTEWLGDTREAIGREKAGIFRAGKPAIVGDPAPPRSVIDHANAVGADLWLVGRDFRCAGDRQQWAWTGRERRYAGLANPALRGANQLLNASAALAALEALHTRLPVTAQAVRLGLATVDLPGRFQIVPGQPALVLDVAHNPHAVAALALNLDAMGFYPATHAVFGAMRDKDYPAILARMDALVDHWYFTDLPTPRAAPGAQLRDAWRAVTQRAGAANAAPGMAADAQVFADPAQALAAAAAAATPVDRILVFGSFHTVGGVLTHGVPRLTAGRPHPTVH